MDNILDYLREATSGKGSLRFIIQPTVAILLGIKAGRADAKAGALPYLMFLLFGSEGRREALVQAAKHVAKVFIAAVVIDGIIQYLAYGAVRPGWAVTVGRACPTSSPGGSRTASSGGGASSPAIAAQ